MEAAPVSIRRARPLLGTFVEIAVDGQTFDAAEAAVEAAFAAIATVHRLMSFHEAVQVPDWTYQVLEAARDLHRRSGGMFDISVAPALQRLGLLPGGHDRIQLLAENRVRFADPSVKIDLGGIAKGFAVDRAVEALLGQGIAEGLVNAGGDLRVFGPRSHAVDIRDPRQPDRALYRVALRDAALASSAGRFDPTCSRHALDSGVIDPATAMPVRSIIGATVCAPSCVIADALTKVVMNAGEGAAAILEHYGANALFVSARGQVHITADWKNEVHLAA